MRIGLVATVLILGRWHPAPAEDREPTIVAVSEGGIAGVLDATFGQALARARQAAAETGDTAFLLESASGLRSLDGSANRFVVRFELLPALADDLLAQLTVGPQTGFDAALRQAEPSLQDRLDHANIADWMWIYHVREIVGLLGDGGVPPEIHAVTDSRDLAPVGDGSETARWFHSGNLLAGDWQTDFDLALDAAAEAMPPGTERFVYRVVTWDYRRGGIAGFNDGGIIVEARPLPAETGPLPLAGEPETAVAALRELINANDWPALARHFDLAGSDYDASELQSGAFFLRYWPPLEADPAELWRYRRPFHPAAVIDHVETGADPNIVTVVMAVEIDQGGGATQRALGSFRMRKAEGGFLVLPD